MGSCAKCGRGTPPSGKCVFCGDDAFKDFKGHREASGFKLWAARLVNLAVVAGILYGAYWLFFTAPGRAALDSAVRKLKLKSDRAPASAAQTILSKFPKVAAMISGGKYTIQEDKVDEQNYDVVFLKREGSQLQRVAFSVNVITENITPMDEAASAALKP